MFLSFAQQGREGGFKKQVHFFSIYYLVLGRKGGRIALIFLYVTFLCHPIHFDNFHATLFYTTPKKLYFFMPTPNFE